MLKPNQNQDEQPFLLSQSVQKFPRIKTMAIDLHLGLLGFLEKKMAFGI